MLLLRLIADARPFHRGAFTVGRIYKTEQTGMSLYVRDDNQQIVPLVSSDGSGGRGLPRCWLPNPPDVTPGDLIEAGIWSHRRARLAADLLEAGCPGGIPTQELAGLDDALVLRLWPGHGGHGIDERLEWPHLNAQGIRCSCGQFLQAHVQEILAAAGVLQ